MTTRFCFHLHVRCNRAVQEPRTGHPILSPDDMGGTLRDECYSS